MIIINFIKEIFRNIKFYDYIYIFLIVLFLLFFHGFYKRLILMRMFYGSLFKINHFGNVVAVSGPIRSGKTTLVAGLSHLYTFKIINSLQSRIHEIELILKEINFKKFCNKLDLLNLDLDSYLGKFNFIIDDFIQSDDFGQWLFSHDLNVPYFDFLKYQDKLDLLKEYVYLYLHLKRVNYVFSNVRMFNHVTNSYSFEFDNNWIKLKEHQDFPLLENSVFVEDDKLIYDSNIGTMKKLYQDSGSDLFYRLFGHLFREKSYYICSVQDINRWLKLEREIAQTHIYVFSSNVVGNFPKLNMFLQFYESIISYIYNIFQRVYKNEQYFNENNWFKRRFYKIHQLRKKLFSKAFVRFDVGIYSDIEKVGKEIKQDDEHSYYYAFVLPVCYVYGSLNTHEFHCLYDYLYNRSKLKYSDLKETKIKEDEILDILKKYDEKINTKSGSNIDDNNSFIYKSTSSNDLSDFFK